MSKTNENLEALQKVIDSLNGANFDSLLHLVHILQPLVWAAIVYIVCSAVWGGIKYCMDRSESRELLKLIGSCQSTLERVSSLLNKMDARK